MSRPRCTNGQGQSTVSSHLEWYRIGLHCSAARKSTELCGDDHAPVTRGRMRAQYPLPHGPTAERATIASLQRQIPSFEGVIKTLRRELAESRGEPAPTRPSAAVAAPAASTIAAAKAKAATPAATAAADKAAAFTARTTSAWHLARQNHSRRCQNAQAKQAAAKPPPPPPPPTPFPVRVGWHWPRPAELGAPRRVALSITASTRLPLRLLAALLGTAGHQGSPRQDQPMGSGRRWGGVCSFAPLRQAGPGGATYASAMRSAARVSRPGDVRVVAATGRTKGFAFRRIT